MYWFNFAIVKATILGHLSWTLMNASGNRGDDIRALRLCEMQLYFFLHPNNETCIPAVLGLQSDMEQKAKRKAMSTVHTILHNLLPEAD